MICFQLCLFCYLYQFVRLYIFFILNLDRDVKNPIRLLDVYLFWSILRIIELKETQSENITHPIYVSYLFLFTAYYISIIRSICAWTSEIVNLKKFEFYNLNLKWNNQVCLYFFKTNVFMSIFLGTYESKIWHQ